MRLDRDEFRTVANAILRFNEYAKDDNAERIVNMMVGIAHKELGNGESYVSTYGFMLTAYTVPGGTERGVKASVSASLFRNLESR